VLNNALGIPDSEFNALVALYNSAGGPNWAHNDYWLRNVSNWYGVTISSGHVTQLKLPNNLLVGTIPSELGDLTYLTLLDLSQNQLTGPLPAELSQLTALQSLILSYNHLTGSLPPELGSLTNLTALHLSQNRLTGSIPAELGSLVNLQMLGLNGNLLLGNVPSSLANLTRLQPGYGSVGLHYNGLYTSDPALETFLTSKFPYWNESQTSSLLTKQHFPLLNTDFLHPRSHWDELHTPYQ
jgi:hypothetical protein